MLRLEDPQDILKTSLGNLYCPLIFFYSFCPFFSAYSFYFSFFLSILFNYFFGNTKYCFFFNIMLIFILRHFFYITTCRIIYFNMLHYKKNVHINAILNKTNILQFFDWRDHHLLVVSVEQQYVRNPFIKIKYDRTIIAKYLFF